MKRIREAIELCLEVEGEKVPPQEFIRVQRIRVEGKMRPFEKCPVCGGELVEKEVEKLLKGGVHMAVLRVRAEVCLRCGERLYDPETVKRFDSSFR